MEERRPGWFRRNRRWIAILFLAGSVVLAGLVYFILMFSITYLASEGHSWVPNASYACLLWDHTCRALSRQVTLGLPLPDTLYTDADLADASGLITPGYPVSEVSRLFVGYKSGDTLAVAPYLEPLESGFRDRVRDTLAVRQKGRVSLVDSTAQVILSLKPFGDRISLNGVFIDLAALKRHLPVLVDSIIAGTVFERLFDPYNPAPTGRFLVPKNRLPEATWFYMELTLNGEVVYRRGIPAPSPGNMECLSSELPFLEDFKGLKMVVYAPVNAEIVISKASRRMGLLLIASMIFLIIGIALLWPSRVGRVDSVYDRRPT